MALHVIPELMTELRVPLKCSWDSIHDFLNEKFEWVIAAEQELEALPCARRNRYEPGGMVRYMGQSLKLVLNRSRWVVVEQEEGTLYVSCPNPGKPHLVEKHVLNWYGKSAEGVFKARIKTLHSLFDRPLIEKVTPGSPVVRRMKARWGSCSPHGEICLNLLLIKESLPQIDFVIAHELCHLRHFAHNAAFYRLLTQVMPDWKQREAGLGQA